MNRNCLIRTCSGLILLTLTCLGCWEKQSGSQHVQAPPPKIQMDNDLGKVFKDVQVNVFIDGTVSMKGFVSERVSTNYMKVVHQLENSLVNSWEKCSLEFYKFGSKVMPLRERRHLNSLNPSFYQEKGIASETQIDKILANEDIYQPNTVNVIVTDLFQKDGDAVLLSNLLRDKCLTKGLAVGIIGLKSQFDGRIFDAGLRRETFYYASSDDPKTYHPFYLIVLGRHEDVANVCERLKSVAPKDSNPNVSIISRFILNRMTTFEGAQRFNDKVNSNSNLNKVEDMVNDPEGRFLQLRLVNDEEGRVNYLVKPNKAPFVTEFNQEPLEVQVQGEGYSKRSSVCSSAALVVTMSYVMHNFKGSGAKEGALKLSLTIRNKEIQDKRVYRYHVLGYPSTNSFVTPLWWTSWSMDATEVPSFKVNNKASIDGSRTQNLSMLILGLWQANLVISKPKVFDSYVYIRK